MAEPSPKRAKESCGEASNSTDHRNVNHSCSDEICVTAKKSAGGTTSETIIHIAKSATVGDLVAQIAAREAGASSGTSSGEIGGTAGGVDPALITVVCRGSVLKASTVLESLVAKDSCKLPVVYILRKGNGVQAKVSTSTGSSTASTAQAGAPSVSSTASAGSAPSGSTVQQSSDRPGRRVLLLLRHGQCCNDDTGNDRMKELTVHGRHQAEASASHVAALFRADRLPAQRAMLHSTSRRASETAARLPNHLPGLEVWNADLLRETDPTKNPFRAEEVFRRLFEKPAPGASDCLVVVAHNNIILYLLMRAAGIPIDRAAQAWTLFHLRHASITRVELTSTGVTQIVSIGAAGHIPHANITWNNIGGVDMVVWQGGGPQRHKFSGRMILLVRQPTDQADQRGRQIAAVASHVHGLKEYMVSGHVQISCTKAAQDTAEAIGAQLKTAPQLLPDSIIAEPEAVFLQYVCPPTKHSRDTIVLLADEKPILYWLLRSLHMSVDEALVQISSYCLGHASISILNVRSDGSTKVVAFGDTGHLPIDIT